MRIPPVLFVVPLVAAGALIPTLSPDLPTLTGTEIGMTQEAYDRSSVTIDAGQTLTFVNNSHFLHVLVPGQDAIVREQQGVPMLDDALDTHISEERDRYTTAAWTRPGTYFLTCSLHPEMTVRVVVLAQ